MRLENANRQTEEAGTPTDPLGTSATRTVAQEIVEVVRDPRMHASIPLKVARAVVERRVSPMEVGEVLEAIEANRSTIRCTGAYFVACVKRIFQRNEVPW